MASLSGNKITLTPRELPSNWYNALVDMPDPLPPMMSPSGYRVTARELEPLFARPLIEQEFSKRRFIKIPGPVSGAYKQWRPTPMFRAERLERHLGTPAKLFYKFEGGSPSGSYESNTAIAQAHYVRSDHCSTILTGSAGGVWVAAIGHAASLIGVKARIYSVRSAKTGRPHGEAVARLWDAELVASPSEHTRTGASSLADGRAKTGDVAIALAEAYEEATVRDEAKFSISTLLNHAVLHQTIIGLEARKQLKKANVTPDLIVGAIGGGSHFAGLFLPFLRDRLRGRPIRFLAVETLSTPSLTRGVYTYDSGDAAGRIPQVMMYTLGRKYRPPGILARSMRYHGVAPIVSALYRSGQVEAVVHGQRAAFEAGLAFTRAEGIVLSPESMYTVREVIDEAERCTSSGEPKNILFSVTSAVDFDHSPYDALLAGDLKDELPAENAINAAIAALR